MSSARSHASHRVSSARCHASHQSWGMRSLSPLSCMENLRTCLCRFWWHWSFYNRGYMSLSTGRCAANVLRARTAFQQKTLQGERIRMQRCRGHGNATTMQKQITQNGPSQVFSTREVWTKRLPSRLSSGTKFVPEHLATRWHAPLDFLSRRFDKSAS